MVNIQEVQLAYNQSKILMREREKRERIKEKEILRSMKLIGEEFLNQYDDLISNSIMKAARSGKKATIIYIEEEDFDNFCSRWLSPCRFFLSEIMNSFLKTVKILLQEKGFDIPAICIYVDGKFAMQICWQKKGGKTNER